MSEPDWAPLTGFRVAVTSARRAEELECAAAAPRRHRDQRRGDHDGAVARRRRTARAHRGVDRRAARHRDRHHGHRIPRLGGGRRRLGAGQRSARRPRQGAHRLARAEGDRCAARRGPAGGMVAGFRVVARAAAVSGRGRYRRTARRRATARGHRRLGSVPGVSRRTACCRRRSGADPRVPLASRAAQRRLRPVGGGNRRRKVRRGQLHVGTRRRIGADARDGDGHRAPGALGAAHQRARDVRRSCHRAAVGAAGGADVVAGANAVGRVGPPHHRRASAAAVTHRAGGRASAGDPRHLRDGRRCGQAAVPCGDGDDPRAGPSSWRGGVA